MGIRVEFYGLARQRAGVSEIELALGNRETTLGDVLERIGAAARSFGESGLVAGGRLDPTLAANLDGQRFVSDPATPIRDGQSLLILSADAGG